MRVSLIGFCASVFVALGINSIGPDIALAGNKSAPSKSASELVSEALAQEFDGSDSQRTALLHDALQRDPKSAPAHWHSGHVKSRDKWLQYDEIPKLAAEDKRLAAYRLAREKHPDSIDGQLALARWCARQNLADQQRVHLTRVLELNPDHAEARRMLGYRRVNGAWITVAEMKEAEIHSARLAKALREWVPKLLTDRKALMSRNPRKRKAAEERLLAIRDPQAIGAIEKVLLTLNPETARIAVQMLANIDGHEASSALARQTIVSPFGDLRKAATEELRSRPFETFVPGLLSIMVSPIQTRLALHQDVSGRILYRHAFYQEGQDAGQLAVFDTEYRPSLMPAGEDPREWREYMARVRKIDAARKARAREQAVTRQNAIVQEFNGYVCEVLSGATGYDLSASPESWWQWWNDYNEVYVEGYKPTSKTYQHSELITDKPTPRRPPPQRPQRRKDCLAAGTDVWTQSGLMPIEQIRAGDLVLSQNVDTGELTYKPVLDTTIRPKGGLVRISAGDQSIVCSGGHLFWVSGTGWVKARHLQPGSHLHCVAGTISSSSVDEADAQKTYNLVVADFHTYFVGDARIFTHDNTIRTLTNALVPGFVESAE